MLHTHTHTLNNIVNFNAGGFKSLLLDLNHKITQTDDLMIVMKFYIEPATLFGRSNRNFQTTLLTFEFRLPSRLAV